MRLHLSVSYKLSLIKEALTVSGFIEINSSFAKWKEMNVTVLFYVQEHLLSNKNVSSYGRSKFEFWLSIFNINSFVIDKSVNKQNH